MPNYCARCGRSSTHHNLPIQDMKKNWFCNETEMDEYYIHSTEMIIYIKEN